MYLSFKNQSIGGVVFLAILVTIITGCTSLRDIAQQSIENNTRDQGDSPWVGQAYSAASPTEPAPGVENLDRVDQTLEYGLPSNLEVKFEHFSVAQGLSNSNVYSILQDREGFLWFATAFGLNRFDGSQFKVYQNDPDEPNSLSNNVIYSLFEDQSGILWVGTYGGGLNSYEREEDKFIHYHHDPNDASSLSHDVIYVVYGDRENNLWIGTMGGGLNLYDPQNGGFIHYKHDPNDSNSLPNDYVVAIKEDKNGDLWVGTNDGLARFNRQSGKFIRYLHNPNSPHSLSNNRVFSICEDRLGELWIGTTGGGLNRYDRDNNRFVHYRHDPDDPYSLSHDDVFYIVEDRWGVLWVATMGGGLNAYDREKQRFIRYRHDPQNPSSLSNDFINYLYEDREGILWVGTAGQLDKFNRAKEKFLHYFNSPETPSSLNGNMVFSIFEDRFRSMWVGTEQGLNLISDGGNTEMHFENDLRNPDSLVDNWVLDIYEDNSGMLWLGTLEGGLERFDRESGRFLHHNYNATDPLGWNKNHINTIYEDRAGVIWAGTNGGVIQYDREMDAFNDFYIFKDPVEVLSKNEVNAILEDREGILWTAVWGVGLRQFDRQEGVFIKPTIDPEEGNDQLVHYVNVIYEDSVGRLWFGTNGNGLVRYDRERNIFINYDTNNGLSNNRVNAILESKSGHLWLSTDRGLSRFDPTAGVFRNFYVEDGLQGDEFYGSATYRRNGEMWFGGVNGITIFRPEEVHDNPYIPPVVLLSLKQDGMEVKTDKPLEVLKDLQFSWPNNNIEFEFAALSFAQPEKNQQAYLLEGFDKDWNYIGGNRSGRYTNLPSGTYTLRLKGSNNDGVWNEVGAAIQLTIIPPFWQTWWFRGIVAFGVILSAITGYTLRVKGVHTRNLELEELIEDRTHEIERRRKELEALFQADERMHRHFNLEEVLQELVDVAVDILQADKSAVLTWDEDAEKLVMSVARGFKEESIKGLSFAKDEGITGHVLTSGQLVTVEDAVNDPRREAERPETVEIVLSERIRSFMHLPIKVNGGVFGVFNVSFTKDHAFGEDEVRLFSALVQRASDSIKNARSFQEEKRRSEQFRVLNEVGSRITAILDISQLLVEVARLVRQTFGYYHVGIGLVEDGYVVYRFGSGVLWDRGDFQFRPGKLRVGEEGLTGWVAGAGEPLMVVDVSKDPRYVWMEGSKTRSELVVPITIQEEVIGVLDVQSDRLNAFDETDLLVLQSLANQTAVAIQNARLYEQAQQLAVMEERNRLARDLHDSAKQKAFAALAQLGAANGLIKPAPEAAKPHLTEAESLVYDVLQELNILIQEMHPVVLKERGLVTALRDYIFEWSHQNEIAIDFQVEGERSLPLEIEQILYRIAQEALANVSRHSLSHKVEVMLEYCEDFTRLKVKDDGCGFEPSTTQLGLGLRSMRERAEMVAGNLLINSKPGAGTCITAIIPRSPLGLRD